MTRSLFRLSSQTRPRPSPSAHDYHTIRSQFGHMNDRSRFSSGISGSDPQTFPNGPRHTTFSKLGLEMSKRTAAGNVVIREKGTLLDRKDGTVVVTEQEIVRPEFLEVSYVDWTRVWTV